MSMTNIWESVLSAVEKRVNHESFTTWFKPINFVEMDGTALRLRVPDQVFEDWILNNYQDILEESLDEAGISGCSITFEVGSSSVPRAELAKAVHNDDSVSKTRPASIPPARQIFTTTAFPPLQFADPDLSETPLNQKYTFETFVVGSSNQFAHAAALAVADSPSKTYNPLYIYGGVGLGKTHLMCAIGHRIKEQYRHLRLCYISAERFMNELINAIRYDQTMSFRERYRSIDILLIDDIQFIAGKERTQEEFFHTFNALYDGQKQIVISSDCAPKDIPTLEERLHSRFEWGLIADIQPPDLETKVAIIRRKAESEKLELPDNVALFIASKIKSNIRELEGSLIRLTALSSLKGVPISLALAQEAIKNISEEEERSVTIEGIQKVVADYYNLRVADLKSKSNSRNIAVPRQVAMYLCKTLTRSSLPEIGREFGGKHHTTVLHSINKINALYEQKGNFHNIINSLIASCK
ncbi:MAG TPA: chromosomal replication initiator protein DnaA [Blastocatellia bacterium]|nr:chromosomal replication initiator protein DnaA [Blastocatellia bacterium]HMX24833.1 chromosomal replication initiator protein DnaA [Blastocatellia bacterium]HMY71016.1 chromosomal replication initiator protein DnaA [Blastocatellia bacterium]HMZ16718.1 chromosomal replication initiator protein DnaA [Blastocatellia bacterium]HNG32971.1 chromosomal replication initiator protein DnaA [Blastocatellia bacterium]